MGGYIFNKLFRPMGKYFMKPDEYRQKIFQELSELHPEGTWTCADLLTLRRMDDPGAWNVTSIHQHLVPHWMKLHTETGVQVMISGFRSSDDHVSSYISAPGLFLEFAADSTRCLFRSEGVEVVAGGSIFASAFDLKVGDRKFLVNSPNWRTDWNSACQKPSHIVVQELGEEICRMILQPVRAIGSVVEYHSTSVANLSEPQLLSLLSFSVILNARFVS